MKTARFTSTKAFKRSRQSFKPATEWNYTTFLQYQEKKTLISLPLISIKAILGSMSQGMRTGGREEGAKWGRGGGVLLCRRPTIM